jgi:hypothetical protein
MNAGDPLGELTENAATLPVAVGGNLTQIVVSAMFCDTQWPFRNKPKKDGRARKVGAVRTLHWAGSGVLNSESSVLKSRSGVLRSFMWAYTFHCATCYKEKSHPDEQVAF